MKKKETFYIGELSELFNISVDSIRYYEEMDLIRPSRNENNGYRQYSLKDVQSLILIRELINLGFHTSQIQAFMQNRTLASTISILQEELHVINDAIAKLEEQKNSICHRLQTIETARSITEFEKVTLIEYPERPCIMITDDNLPDDFVDYYMVKYMKENHQKITAIGHTDCYTLDLKNSNPSSDYFRTQNVFFSSNIGISESNYNLPAGKYLSLWYQGDLKKTKTLMPKLFDYAKKHHLTVTGEPIEMCHIDSYETTKESEYIIELELPVS